MPSRRRGRGDAGRGESECVALVELRLPGVSSADPQSRPAVCSGECRLRAWPGGWVASGHADFADRVQGARAVLC